MIRIEITDPQDMSKRTLKETGLYLLALAEREDTMFPKYQYLRSEKLPEAYVQSAEDKPAEYSPPEEPEAPEPVEPPSAAEIFAAVKTVRENSEISDIHKKVIEATNEGHVNVGIVPPAPERFVEAGTGVYTPAPQDIEEKYRYGVEIDTEGLPWDGRIHSRTKTKTADGRWKKQRGVGGNTVKTIENELRVAQGIPAPEPQPLPPVAPTPQPQPAPPVVLTPPPFPAQEKAFDFADLMNIVTSAITAGRLTREQVVEVLTPYGIPSLPVVATRPDLIPSIVHALQGVINAPR